MFDITNRFKECCLADSARKIDQLISSAPKDSIEYLLISVYERYEDGHLQGCFTLLHKVITLPVSSILVMKILNLGITHGGVDLIKRMITTKDIAGVTPLRLMILCGKENMLQKVLEFLFEKMPSRSQARKLISEAFDGGEANFLFDRQMRCLAKVLDVLCWDMKMQKLVISQLSIYCISTIMQEPIDTVLELVNFLKFLNRFDFKNTVLKWINGNIVNTNSRLEYISNIISNTTTEKLTVILDWAKDDKFFIRTMNRVIVNDHNFHRPNNVLGALCTAYLIRYWMVSKDLTQYEHLQAVIDRYFTNELSINDKNAFYNTVRNKLLIFIKDGCVKNSNALIFVLHSCLPIPIADAILYHMPDCYKIAIKQHEDYKTIFYGREIETVYRVFEGAGVNMMQ